MRLNQLGRPAFGRPLLRQRIARVIAWDWPVTVLSVALLAAVAYVIRLAVS